MAYIKKYSFPFATKFEQDSVLELWEDTADTTVYEFQGISFQIQYIPSSDNPFEPIYATQLAVTIDVTDDTTGNTSAFIPNLVTLNDKKYLAKLFIGANQVYTGWTLSDSVSLSFSTGRKELSFNCVDGLAMLKDIKFSNGVTFDTNARVSLLSFISNILSNIGFPTGLNINTSVSYYAEGMLDRTDGIQYEPFSQTYVFGNSFIDTDGEFEDCYLILEKIVKSFGARIFQANGEWHIISVNQFAIINRYFTRYNANGTYLNSGTIDNSVEIQPYLNNTSNFYFIDNSQTKLMKKGYNNIISNNNIEYSGNFLYNWTLKYLSSGFPLGWERIVTGNGIVNLIENTEITSNSLQLISEAATSGTATAQITSKIAFARGTKVKVSFDISDWTPSKAIAAKVKLIITDGANTYYYTANGDWLPYFVSYTDFYEVLSNPLPSTTNEIPYSFSVTTNPLPFGGELTFGIYLNDSTGDIFTANNFEIGVESTFKSVNISSRLTNEDTYTLKIDSPLGVPVNYEGFYNYKGFLMLSNGLLASNWYRQEYPVEIFRGLAQLIVRQYSNIYQKNIINLDCNLSSLDTNKGIISSSNLITIGTDTDPDSINIEDDTYIFGNTTIDIYADTIQSTLLQINNINIEGVSIETIYNNGDIRNDFPEGCYCWSLTAVFDNADYSYTDCSGIFHTGVITFAAETIYVQSPVAPLISGTTAVMVDSSYCSI